MVPLALFIVFSPVFFIIFYAVYKTWLYYKKKSSFIQREIKPSERVILPPSFDRKKDITTANSPTSPHDEEEVVAVITAAVNSYKTIK